MANERFPRQLLKRLVIDMGVERLAELREINLIGEIVERHEIERVPDRSATNCRTDLDDRVGLSLTGNVDIDRRRAGFAFAATTIPSIFTISVQGVLSDFAR